MIGTLAFALVLGTQDQGWAVSEKVVDGIIETHEPGSGIDSYTVKSLIYSGNEDLALKLWDATAKDKDAPTVRKYRRDKNLERLIDIRHASWLDQPEVVQDAFYFRDARHIARAAEYVRSQHDPNSKSKVQVHENPLAQFVESMMFDGLDQFGYLVALNYMSREELRDWLKTYITYSSSCGTGMRYLDDEQRQRLGEFLNVAIAKYPELVTGDDLLALARTTGNTDVVDLAAVELLRASPWGVDPEDGFYSVANDFFTLQKVAETLSKNGRRDVAVRILNRHSQFVTGALKEFGSPVSADFISELVRSGAADTLNALATAFESGLEDMDEDKLYTYFGFGVSNVSLLYTSGGINRVERFCRNLKGDAKRYQSTVRMYTAIHMADLGEYEKAIDYIFDYDYDSPDFSASHVLSRAERAVSKDRVKELADRVIDRMLSAKHEISFSSQFLPITMYASRDKAKALLDAKYGSGFVPSTAAMALRAGVEHLSAGLEQEAVELFYQLFEFDARTVCEQLLDQNFGELFDGGNSIAALGDRELLLKYLNALQSSSDKVYLRNWRYEAIRLLRANQDDDEVSGRILEMLRHLASTTVAFSDRSDKAWMLAEAIEGTPHWPVEGEVIPPPLSVELQEKVLAIVKSAN